MPYIFGFASLILFAPYYIVSMFLKPLAIKYESLYSGCELLSSNQSEEALKKIKDQICYHLIELNENKKYITIFIIGNFVYILSLFLVGIFLSIAFNTNFFSVGFKAAFFYVGDNKLAVDERFPIRAWCNVTTRGQSNGSTRLFYHVNCNLSTNLILSKIVGMLFVLHYLIALPLAILDTIYTLSYFCCQRRGYNSRALVMFLIKDTVSPTVYGMVKQMFKARMVQIVAENAKDASDWMTQMLYSEK